MRTIPGRCSHRNRDLHFFLRNKIIWRFFTTEMLRACETTLSQWPICNIRLTDKGRLFGGWQCFPNRHKKNRHRQKSRNSKCDLFTGFRWYVKHQECCSNIGRKLLSRRETRNPQRVRNSSASLGYRKTLSRIRENKKSNNNMPLWK